MQMLEYSPMDLDYDDPNDAPVCVCADYHGTTAVTFCRACGAYTDDLELIALEAAEQPAAVAVSAPVPAPRKPMATANAHVAEPFRSILNSFAGCR
jgi:hypothetical protein